MWQKHCIFPHKTLWIATNHFVQSLSFFLSSTQLFFPSWNISSIIHLVSITYLVLVHNYNTIKYICFIRPHQRAGMLSFVSNKTNWEIHMLINNNKFVDSTKKLSRKLRKYIKKKVKYLFKFEIGSLKF